MSYNHLIDRLFTSPADRAIAQAFADGHAGQPFSERAIPAMLNEAAQINARIINGELSPQQGRELLISTAVEGYGLPPQIVEQGKSFLDKTLAQFAEGEAAPEPVSAEPPGPHDRLIQKLFVPADRPEAAAIAKAMEAHPQFADRTGALLTELAKPTDGKSPDEAYAYISSFAESIGIPSYIVTSVLDAGTGPAEAAHDAAVLHELVGDLTPRAQHAQRVAEREAAQKDIVRIQALMNAPPGSAEWKQYWHGEVGAKTQQEYRAALEASLVEPPTAAPPTAPAPAPAAAPAAPAPAPAVEPPAP
jgi:hypothetical protein